MKSEFNKGLAAGLIFTIIFLSMVLIFCKYFDTTEIAILAIVGIVWSLSQAFDMWCKNR